MKISHSNFFIIEKNKQNMKAPCILHNTYISDHDANTEAQCIAYMQKTDKQESLSLSSHMFPILSIEQHVSSLCHKYNYAFPPFPPLCTFSTKKRTTLLNSNLQHSVQILLPSLSLCEHQSYVGMSHLTYCDFITTLHTTCKIASILSFDEILLLGCVVNM